MRFPGAEAAAGACKQETVPQGSTRRHRSGAQEKLRASQGRIHPDAASATLTEKQVWLSGEVCLVKLTVNSLLCTYQVHLST